VRETMLLDLLSSLGVLLLKVEWRRGRCDRGTAGWVGLVESGDKRF
jgi:hypothetical protein